MARPPVPKIERFLDRVTVMPDGCWHWSYPRATTGYGVLYDNDRKLYGLAHRYSYELFIGPIPEETLDHLCRVRHCVNPAHLEPVSKGDNTLRGETITGRNKRKTHCKRGHPLSGANVIPVPGGGRSCRECSRRRSREYQQRRRKLMP
jgi:hypothetical protein